MMKGGCHYYGRIQKRAVLQTQSIENNALFLFPAALSSHLCGDPLNLGGRIRLYERAAPIIHKIQDRRTVL